MCRDYGWPEEWGDPAKTIPVPCEMVHMGCGPSCEKHALMRFTRAWLFAAPLSCVVRWEQVICLSRIFRRSFLLWSMPGSHAPGAPALFLQDRYTADVGQRSMCSEWVFTLRLERAVREGPAENRNLVFRSSQSGSCVVPAEIPEGGEYKPHGVNGIDFFAPPNGHCLAADVVYLQHQWREHLTFTLSAAVILTAAQERPERVRGVFGKLLRGVLGSKA
ncbi:Ankyrin repeat containing protein [Macrophomina phaseolina MS6]|uniref:Ankyrin repeat containing protein n=1 Tax=Macrophomina phaseolina (strain MS6) TaxID=1126212 RepID=K2R6B7_MACPH|nr:Ankyrin repeat containing protein [Macrophomina phaseolina MS6]